VFFVLNPQSWHHPISWTVNWVSQFRAREQTTHIPSLFFGTKYDFRAPWFAPIVFLWITTPPAILLLAGVTACDAARRLWNGGWANLWPELRSPWVLMTAAGGSTLVACCLPGVPNHDQERLFLPVQPFLVIGAAYGFYLLSQSAWLSRWSSRWIACPTWLPATALAALLIVPSLAVAAHFHPYELTYFNVLVGGPHGAEKLGFDPAYLKLEVNQEVLDAINSHVDKDALVWSNFMYYDLLLQQKKGRIRPDIQLVNQVAPNYVIVYARNAWMAGLEKDMMQHPETAVWKLEHDGVVIVALFKVQVNAR
jgi:hypothetical protein